MCPRYYMHSDVLIRFKPYSGVLPVAKEWNNNEENLNIAWDQHATVWLMFLAF